MKRDYLIQQKYMSLLIVIITDISQDKLLNHMEKHHTQESIHHQSPIQIMNMGMDMVQNQDQWIDNMRI